MIQQQPYPTGRRAMDHWHRIETLFSDALDHSTASRARFIEKQCADEPHVKAQVMALLEADQASEDFLNTLSESLFPLIEQPSSQKLGQYRLLEQLGRGGMGVVYKAFDDTLQRQVAIKLLPLYAGNHAAEKARFQQEAQAAARLNHPNVCEVYELGESEEGQLYIVTAFCEGDNLAELISQQVLTLGDILTITLQLCDALQRAHDQGIYHRDIKPANVIVDRQKHIKLVDFGIAKISGHDLSQTGQLIGTFAYMAPEQFSGGLIDQQVDIWALGILLYECLTGRRPFDGETPASIMYQLFHNASLELTIDLPCQSTFNQIIQRCLQVEKSQRYTSMAQLAQALRRLRTDLQARQQLDDLPPGTATEGACTLPSQVLPEYRRITTLALTTREPITTEAITGLEQAIEQFSGQIHQRGEQQLIACFGLPRLAEGATQQALQCAYHLWQTNQDTGNSFSIERLLIHASPVVIDRRAASGEQHLTGKITGDIIGGITTLLSLAPPNCITLTESARSRLRNVTLETLKTSYESAVDTTLFSFLPSPAGIFAQANQPYRNRFCGRTHELGLLTNAWHQSCEGDPHAVLISGEAGMGKSRLVHALRQQLPSAELRTVFLCQCDVNQQDTALYPLLSALQSTIQQSPGANFSEKIRHWLSGWRLTEATDQQILQWLLADPDQDQTLALRESAESLKNKSFELLDRLLHRVVEQHPLLWIIEDLHWADPSFIEWLDRLLASALPERLCLILTSRPDVFSRWQAHHQLAQLVLHKLGQHHSQQLLQSLILPEPLTAEQQSLVLEKTAGNPLFMEEYAHMLAGVAATPVAEIAHWVPNSLEEVLHYRLDKLGSAKAVAQTAAVIGQAFSQPLLQAVMGHQQVVGQHLQTLQQAAIVFRRGDGFRFKHALIRDALYRALPSDQRQEIHFTIARQLASQNNSPPTETIAYHYSQAQQPTEAVPWWLKAADKAHDNHAVREVIRLCTHGLKDLGHCPANRDSQQWEMRLQLLLGAANMAALGYAHPEAGGAHQRALELGKRLQREAETFPAMVGRWAYLCVRAEHQTALQLAQTMEQLAQTTQSDDFALEAAMALGVSKLFLGELAPSITHFRTCLALYNPTVGQRHAQLFGQDPGVVVLSFYAIASEAMGEGDKALRLSRRAITTARDSQHPFSLAYALGFAVHIHVRQAQLNQAQALADENQQLCSEHGIHVFQLLGQIQQALLLLAKNQVQQGITMMEASIPPYTAMGASIFLPSWQAVLALSYLKLGDIAAAQQALACGQAQMAKSGELLGMPYLAFAEQQLEASCS